MTDCDIFQAIVFFGVTPAALVAGAVYLAKFLIEHFSKSDLDTFKAELEKAAEIHKRRLDRLEAPFQKRQAELIVRRADAIIELYSASLHSSRR